MVEEPRTKDVFRELDGFLVMVGMLSALALPEVQGQTIIDPEQQMEITRLAFAIISEAMRDHFTNSTYFNVSTSVSEFAKKLTVAIETSRLCTTTTGRYPVGSRSTNICPNYGVFTRIGLTQFLALQSFHEPPIFSPNSS